MYNKKLIRDEYIEALKAKLIKAKRSYEIARKDTIEAEGRMVTRYDSTKTETGWLADGYLKTVKELESCIKELETKEIPKEVKGEKIGIESLVILEDEIGEIENYYIVEFDGGMEIEVNGKLIFCISKKSPLALELLGKKGGDIATLNQNVKFRIMEVR